LHQQPRKKQNCSPRALILAPTRELAAQIDASVRTYGRFVGVKGTAVFGGVKQGGQVKALRRGVDILVATPGRLLDLLQQKHVNLRKVEVFILDEVDRMLDMGFIPDVKKIVGNVPADRQTLFFSATMEPKISKVASSLVPRQPVRVEIASNEPSVDRIQQKVLFVGKKNKDELLLSILNSEEVCKALVFTQMKHVASRVSKKLAKAGIRSTDIHGNKSQGARTRALEGFRRNRFEALVATDVAARGLDVDDITHVFNYDLPMEALTYVHRIGRTARAGAGGAAISFCSSGDRSYLDAIEKLLGSSVPVDRDHDYHCDEAFKSRQAPRKRKAGYTKGRRKQRGKRRSYK
jgi:ATP-dependent RNA helicase RhlE